MRLFSLRVVVGACLLLSNYAAADSIVTRQPAPSDAMDTFFGSYFSTTAQHLDYLRVGGWGDEYDTLIRFDLS